MLKRYMVYILKGFLLTLGVVFFWAIGFVFFIHLIPPFSSNDVSLTDGIVVFTGEKERLHAALRLFQEKKARYLLISGVNPHVSLSQRIKTIPAKENITLGYTALNTIGNAQETALWAHKHHITSLRLVTSNYHMPRSLLQLRYKLPHVKIFPYPIAKRELLQSKWWLDSSTLALIIQEYNKFLYALVQRGFIHLYQHIGLQDKMDTP